MDGLNNAVIPGHATPEQYVREITIANDGIVNQKTVMAYATRSFPMIEELARWGVKFECDETGTRSHNHTDLVRALRGFRRRSGSDPTRPPADPGTRSFRGS